MILRIKDSDFSEFAGMRKEKANNIILDKYINIFYSNSDLIYFQIENDGSMYFDIVCYIQSKLKNCKMFTKIDYDDDGAPIKFWLCFAKMNKEDSII